MSSDLSAYITPHLPPEKRQRYCEGGIELKLCEAAVQLAFSLYLLGHEKGGTTVEMYPDGEHAKRFNIPSFLTADGFSKTATMGSTAYGGTYERDGQILIVNPKSQHRRGDVVGTLDGIIVRAECKGGIINSRHSGARSSLGSGFNELIGQTMSMTVDGARHIAVAPQAADSELQASRLRDRCQIAGIEIALITCDGGVIFA